MKLNWGNKIFIVYFSFVAGMLLLVWLCAKQRVDLVSKDYYPQELKFQQKIDAAGNAAQLSGKVTVSGADGGIVIRFPEEMKNRQLTGEIWFYCAADARADKKLAVKADAEGVQWIPAEQVKNAAYTVKIDWSADGKSYYSEQKYFH